MCWTLRPRCLRFAFICRSWGAFCASEGEWELQAAAPKCGDEPALGLGKAAARLRTPKARCDPKAWPQARAESKSKLQPPARPRALLESPVLALTLPSPAPWCWFPWAAQSTGMPGRGVGSPRGCQALAVTTLSRPSSSSPTSPGLAPRPRSHSHIPVNQCNERRCIVRT